MEAAAAELRSLVNGGSLILLVVAVTGVLNLLHLWSARLRVSACEKEPGIVRPFITCCPRQDWGRRASRDSPGVYYAALRNQARGRPRAKARFCPE